MQRSRTEFVGKLLAGCGARLGLRNSSIGRIVIPIRRPTVLASPSPLTAQTFRSLWIAVFAVIATAGTANMSAGRADEADAKRLLKAMSDYLGAQKAISFDYDVSLELVSTQQQKIALVSSGTVTLNRPDKLHLTRTGGFSNLEMVFDGKTLTLLVAYELSVCNL